MHIERVVFSCRNRFRFFSPFAIHLSLPGGILGEEKGEEDDTVEDTTLPVLPSTYFGLRLNLAVRKV